MKDRYSSCSEVDFHTNIRVCEIRTGDDEMKIERFGLSGCYGSTLSCAEGGIKTCMPLMTINNLHFRCFCHSTDEVTPVVSDHYWTAWQKLTKNFRGFMYQRKLLIKNGADYVAEEYTMGIQYIVADNNLPDSVFTASSHWWNNQYHSPNRARIDNYFDGACAWVANTLIETGPFWLQISLPGLYDVIGVYIRQRCDIDNYPTVIDVTTSVDDVLWQDVVRGEDIANRYSSYDMQGSVNVWFSRKYTSRYWKIYIVDYIVRPSMKCELIGDGI